jgi:ComF family protein
VLDQRGVDAAMPFDGVARQALLALKFRNRRVLVRHLAKLMVRRLGLDAVGARRPDVVTWAPTSRARTVQRGFDQAELLARAVARELGVPCRRLLYRAHGPAQTGRGRAERLQGPSFRSRPAARPYRVLLVDDVVTTGATLHAAAAALRAAGVTEVRAVAAAATPGHTVGGTRPASARTVATAGRGSVSTSTPTMPTASAAATFDPTSSRKAVRPASAPSLARAS